MLTDRQLARLTSTRARTPERIAEAARSRVRPNSAFDDDERELIIAADGALRPGPNPMAMANRRDLLRRLCVALTRPGVTGVLGTADILEDLLLLGALNDRSVFGAMNRPGTDDRFTGYDVRSLTRSGFDGGAILLRIDHDDERTAATLAACATAVTALAEEKLVAMVEPFVSHRVNGRPHDDLSVEATATAVTIASALGATSAYTWLKIPVIGDGGDAMAAVLGATTLPTLLLGGEVTTNQEATFKRWAKALRHPTVRGLVVGRSLLYPPDGDVARAVDTTVGLL